MSVTVYPQLAALLEQRRLSAAELERQIKARFGVAVNAKSFYRLTQPAPVQRADLEIAGATASILGVGIDDLFRIETSFTEDEGQASILGVDESRRLAALMERQDKGLLESAELAELDALISLYGRTLHDRRMHLLAQQRGISGEQVERKAAAELERARAWWDALERNPARDQIVAEQAAALRAQWPE